MLLRSFQEMIRRCIRELERPTRDEHTGGHSSKGKTLSSSSFCIDASLLSMPGRTVPNFCSPCVGASSALLFARAHWRKVRSYDQPGTGEHFPEKASVCRVWRCSCPNAWSTVQHRSFFLLSPFFFGNPSRSLTEPRTLKCNCANT